MSKTKKPALKVWSIFCPECTLSWYYFRKKDSTYACRKCGTLFRINEKTGKSRRVLKKRK